jgi:hypothetical protein
MCVRLRQRMITSDRLSRPAMPHSRALTLGALKGLCFVAALAQSHTLKQRSSDLDANLLSTVAVGEVNSPPCAPHCPPGLDLDARSATPLAASHITS